MITYYSTPGRSTGVQALTGNGPGIPTPVDRLHAGPINDWIPQTKPCRPARQSWAGGGRKGVLSRPEQKLLFILVYLKTYPIQ